jgi:phage terminase small subunit
VVTSTADTLTPRQQRFVEEYLVDLNAKQAAIRAGYSPKTAEHQGARLLSYAKVAAAVAAGRSRRSRRAEVSADRVLQELARIAYSDPRKLFNADGSLRPPHELDDDTAAALASLEVVEERGQRFVRRVRKWDKVRALELLAKHLGLTPERTLNIDLSRLSDEQLRRIAEGEDAVAVLAASSQG